LERVTHFLESSATEGSDSAAQQFLIREEDLETLRAEVKELENELSVLEQGKAPQ
jgi:hypothetical protein